MSRSTHIWWPVIAHALAIIRRDIFSMPADPGKVACAALFHDASEIITGDMPTPIKYHNSHIRLAYKQIEAQASQKLLKSLPVQMRKSYTQVLTDIDEETQAIVKAADKLSAYIKCIEELKTGNNEFRSAAEQTLAKLEQMNMPEVKYFIDNFIPAFELTLDELNFSVD